MVHIGKKPGMYFSYGDISPRSIAFVSAFITGFQHGQRSPADTLDFGYFTRWVAAHYRVVDGPMSGFSLILERVGGDDALAFDEFFRLLPLFLQDYEQIGPDGIAECYGRVMKEITT